MELLLDNFAKGEMTLPAATQLPDGAATKAANVIFDPLGNLGKQKGLKSKFTLPSGVTLISFIEFEWNLPSPYGRKQTTILYGTDAGGRHELWWNPYWDTVTAAWVDGWQELTEFEGPYNMDASTDTTNVLDTELSVATADYYNKWFLFNITRFDGMMIKDYTLSPQTLVLEQAIGLQASGDKYLIYRFPLRRYFEGPHNADNTETTPLTLVDAALKSDLDDDYVNWKLNNTNRSITVTVSDYDGSEKKLIHPAVSGQSSGDGYNLRIETHDIAVDDIVRFFPRENAVEMSLGNGNGYPKMAPLLFSFITDTWYFNPNDLDGNAFEGFYLSRNVMSKPDTKNVNTIVLTDAGTGTLAIDTWHFKKSYVYDGYQEGPLSTDSITNNNSGGLAIDIEVREKLHGFEGLLVPGEFDAVLDRRITHVRLYAAKGDTNDIADNYFLLCEIPVVSGFAKGFILWTLGGVSSLQYLSTGLTLRLDDGIWNGTDIDDNADGQVPFGKFLRWDINQGHGSEKMDANYKFRAFLDEQHYKAPIFTDKQRDAFVGYSVQANGAGVPVDDVIPLENFLNLSQKGILEVTGAASIRGFLFVFAKNKVFRYASGRQLIDFPTERGNIAPNSILEIDEIIYFASSDDVYAFDGNNMRKLMYGKILDQWDALTITQKEAAFAGYQKEKNCYWLVAGTSYFIFDITLGVWRRREFASATPIWFAAGIDGELFVGETGEIHTLDASDWDEDITCDYRTKVFDLVKEIKDVSMPVRGNFDEIALRYKSDNKISVKIFDPDYSTVYPLADLTFFPNTKFETVIYDGEFMGFEAGRIEIRISDINQGSQPDALIDYLKAHWDPVQE